MKERPILFSAPMVRAILDGSKTQTRRAVKRSIVGDPKCTVSDSVTGIAKSNQWIDDETMFSCPYGQPGDQLWVRETWAVGKGADVFAPSVLHPGTWLNDNGGLWYHADNTVPPAPISPRGKTRVSIHMPRWASRIQLEIVSVRVERLNDIGEDDALNEGIYSERAVVGASCAGGYHREIMGEIFGWDGMQCDPFNSAIDAFQGLWESINGAGSWSANPLVWVVEFKRIGGAS